MKNDWVAPALKTSEISSPRFNADAVRPPATDGTSITLAERLASLKRISYLQCADLKLLVAPHEDRVWTHSPNCSQLAELIFQSDELVIQPAEDPDPLYYPCCISLKTLLWSIAIRESRPGAQGVYSDQETLQLTSSHQDELDMKDQEIFKLKQQLEALQSDPNNEQ